jgi:hypothetical protein
MARRRIDSSGRASTSFDLNGDYSTAIGIYREISRSSGRFTVSGTDFDRLFNLAPTYENLLFIMIAVEEQLELFESKVKNPTRIFRIDEDKNFNAVIGFGFDLFQNREKLYQILVDTGITLPTNQALMNERARKD